MSGVTISERCSCGATFTVTCMTFPNDTLNNWRTNHRHQMPEKETSNGLPPEHDATHPVPTAAAEAEEGVVSLTAGGRQLAGRPAGSPRNTWPGGSSPTCGTRAG